MAGSDEELVDDRPPRWSRFIISLSDDDDDEDNEVVATPNPVSSTLVTAPTFTMSGMSRARMPCLTYLQLQPMGRSSTPQKSVEPKTSVPMTSLPPQTIKTTPPPRQISPQMSVSPQQTVSSQDLPQKSLLPQQSKSSQKRVIPQISVISGKTAPHQISAPVQSESLQKPVRAHKREPPKMSSLSEEPAQTLLAQEISTESNTPLRTQLQWQAAIKSRAIAIVAPFKPDPQPPPITPNVSSHEISAPPQKSVLPQKPEPSQQSALPQQSVTLQTQQPATPQRPARTKKTALLMELQRTTPSQQSVTTRMSTRLQTTAFSQVVASSQTVAFQSPAPPQLTEPSQMSTPDTYIVDNAINSQLAVYDSNARERQAVGTKDQRPMNNQWREWEVNMPSGLYVPVLIPAERCRCEGQCTFELSLLELNPEASELEARECDILSREMRNTIRQHSERGGGGRFTSYEIVKIEKVRNCCLWKKFRARESELFDEAGYVNERMLFHGSKAADEIVKTGFRIECANRGGMFGPAVYFAELSSKSNQYAYGYLGGTGCPTHSDKSCYVCERKLLICRVALGKMIKLKKPNNMTQPPPGYHSVMGQPSRIWGGLKYREYAVYNVDQAYPEYILTYKIVE